jgi:DNA-directed RNA polymerase subunit RPC12/RpoP
MNIMDNFIGFIIDNLSTFLTSIGVIILSILILNHRKKITNEYVCPNCKTPANDRISRNLFDKLISSNINSKKFKCLKCWKIFYVIETTKNN